MYRPRTWLSDCVKTGVSVSRTCAGKPVFSPAGEQHRHLVFVQIHSLALPAEASVWMHLDGSGYVNACVKICMCLRVGSGGWEQMRIDADV